MRNNSYLVHGIILFLWCISSLNSQSVFSGNEPDRLVLLAFRVQTKDPLGTLSSWNNSLHHCNWPGVTCSRRNPNRVTALDLKSRKLEGTLYPHIGNLTFLRRINFTMNNFHGPIPQELGRLFRLEQLYLDSNSFDGSIPTNLSRCSNLRMINLVSNKLSGGIPEELTTLSKLTMLYLAKNELKGSIPSSLGNLSSLTFLSITETSLTGTIPSDLCRLQNLEFFQVASNELSGIVPSCLYNLSRIKIFSVANNHLEGTVPRDIGLNLPNLQGLYLGTNKFNGIIPLSLSNASRLEMISLESNVLTGQVPRELGRLQSLRALALHSNQLGSKFGDDLNFVTSLTNCSNLEHLSVYNNSLNGSLPNSVGNLSATIRLLQFGKNQIYGSIPTGIKNLVNLNGLDFSDNHLTGEIPHVIEMFPEIRNLYFNGNQFSGRIPDSFTNATLLTVLNLSRNKLHGTIPPSLGNCSSLAGLRLSNNRLNGTIPKQVIGLSSLKTILDLSNNALSGSLPSEVGNLTSLVILDVSGNRLSGHLPNALGKCLTLGFLYMDSNVFEGNIPPLSELKGVKVLNLSNNKLSGQIPEYLVNLTRLTYLNLSYNELEGPVPKGGVFANASILSVNGNRKLCGGSVGLKLLACHINKKGKSTALKVVTPVVVVCLALALCMLFFFMFFKRRMSKKKPSSPPFYGHQYMRISYADLLKATNNFSVDNLIGVGSYSSVYKGVIDQDNTIVAVKVLNPQQRGASKSFFSECNALKNLRHRNLLKIITSCSSMDFQGNDFKALVFEFMPNRSLEEWLHPKINEQHELSNLNFLQRLNIAIDVASALEYLHHHCQPPIVHCDLKPCNVLLDNDMIAHVADFGLAKIFSTTSSDSSQNQDSLLAIKGTIGYVAPEYGMGREVSTQGDVYSYGILLLEMFTEKRPTDSMFQNGLSLHNFVEIALHEQVMNIVNPMMLQQESSVAINVQNQSDKVKECLVSVTRLGVTCSAESPMERMNMGEVFSELCHIKDYYQGFRSI